MPTWTGIALARAAPGQDAMESRLSTYLHPLAGRPLAWHTLAALAALRPARLVLETHSPLNPEVFPEVGMPVEHVIRASEPADDDAGVESVIVVDAAAPLLAPVLTELLDAGPATYLADAVGAVSAAHLAREDAARFFEGEGELSQLPASVGGMTMLPTRPEALIVTNRSSLARAASVIRDRIVARLMEGGTTFLLPDSVVIDVDVRIGRDTVVYPGVVIEGETTIGDETVIGPGCRIVDSWIGSGVELKGWNFISRASIRNRAILEPHVRRGFD